MDIKQNWKIVNIFTINAYNTDNANIEVLTILCFMIEC